MSSVQAHFDANLEHQNAQNLLQKYVGPLQSFSLNSDAGPAGLLVVQAAQSLSYKQCFSVNASLHCHAGCHPPDDIDCCE